MFHNYNIMTFYGRARNQLFLAYRFYCVAIVEDGRLRQLANCKEKSELFRSLLVTIRSHLHTSLRLMLLMLTMITDSELLFSKYEFISLQQEGGTLLDMAFFIFGLGNLLKPSPVVCLSHEEKFHNFFNSFFHISCVKA